MSAVPGGARAGAATADAGGSAIRYRKLGRVELNVTDLERSRRFYRELVGLQEVEASPPGTAAFRCDAEPYSLVLHAAPEPGLKRVAWLLEDARALDALHARLRAHGVPFESVPDADCRVRGLARATRLVDPGTGATQEFHLAGAGPVVPPFEPAHTRILRLGHVVLAGPRHAESVAFWRDVLGFRESDRIVGGTTFLRPYPSPFHHGLGLGRAPRPRLHHFAFMVAEVDDVGRALHRMRRHRVPVVFGPGRHPASGSVFLYFLDPDGLTVEYTCGMETFDAQCPRAPLDWPAEPESVDTWGAPRDSRLGAVGALESAAIAAG